MARIRPFLLDGTSQVLYPRIAALGSADDPATNLPSALAMMGGQWTYHGFTIVNLSPTNAYRMVLTSPSPRSRPSGTPLDPSPTPNPADHVLIEDILDIVELEPGESRSDWYDQGITFSHSITCTLVDTTTPGAPVPLTGPPNTPAGVDAATGVIVGSLRAGTKS